MSKLFGKSFWFCLAFFSNLLVVKNTVFAAETTAAQVPIPEAQEPIALSETQHQLAAETDAPSQAVSVVPRPRKQSTLARQQTPQKAN
jgi:hypothetical protein